MHEADKKKMKKFEDFEKRKVKKKFTCPNNHKTDFNLTGNFQTAIILCEDCNKGYELTKKEVEAL